MCLSCPHGLIWRGGQRCCLFYLHIAGLLLDSVLQHQATLPLLQVKSITGGTSSEAIANHDVLDTRPKEGGNLVGTSKTRFRMVFLVGTAAYKGSKTQSACHPLANFLHQPITIQYSLMLIGFSAWWVELQGADQRKITCRHHLLVLCMCSCGEKT